MRAEVNMSSDTKPGGATPPEARVIECKFEVRKLAEGQGKGELIASTNIKGKPADILARIEERAKTACDWWDEKTRKKGCEVCVTATYAGAAKNKGGYRAEKTYNSCKGDPATVAKLAADIAKESIENLKAGGTAESGVKDVMGDVITTAAEFVNESYGYLPMIDAAANGNPQAAIAAVGGAMLKDPEGQAQIKELSAAIGGDAGAMAELEKKAADFPMGNMLMGFLKMAQQDGSLAALTSPATPKPPTT